MRRRLNASLTTAAIALVAVVGLPVMLAGCDGGSGGSGDYGAYGAVAEIQTGSTQDTTGGPSQTTSTAADPARPQAPEIRRVAVRDGKPVAGVARLEYESGERVRFAVQSDVAGEVHVHGFDITKDVPANGSVRFEFPADIEGVFEIELHGGSHFQIAELRISP